MMQVPGDGGLVTPGVAWGAAEEDPLMLGGSGSGSGGIGSFPDLAEGYTEGSLPDFDWIELFDGSDDSLFPSTYQLAFDENSSLTNQQAAVVGSSCVMICSPPTPPVYEQANHHQPGSNSSGMAQEIAANDSPVLASSPLGAYPHAPTAAPDSEVAQMVRVAAECGADRASSTVWSEEEDQLLRQGLSQFADQDNVIKCFIIASTLAKKTTLDVAYRIRWLSDLERKREAAKRADQLAQKISAGEKVTKVVEGLEIYSLRRNNQLIGQGKGAKGSTKKNNKCPLSVSEEAVNSKSPEDLKRDNNRLMDRIEYILKTGQFEDIPDYFYRMKMNMDALNNKMSNLGGLPVVDKEEWEDVLRDRSSSKSDQSGN